MRAGAPILRHSPSGLTIILRERPAIRNLSGTRHDRVGSGRRVLARRARMAVEAAVPRGTVPPKAWTGPLSVSRRDP